METHFANLEDAHSRIARERVLDDLRTLARDSEDLLKATAGDVSDKAREARTRLTAALERAKVTYDEVQGQTMEQARAAAQKADTTIRTHPYESIGFAFGVGLLFGLVLGRR